MKVVFALFTTLLVGSILSFGQVAPPGGTTGTTTGTTSGGTGGAGGGWKIDLTYSGSISPAPAGGSSNWQNSPESPNTSVGQIWESQLVNTYEVKTEGDITVTIAWDGHDANGNPTPAPELVSVLFTPSASINGGGDIDGSLVAPHYDISDGFNDTVYEAESPFFTAHASGSHIKTFKYGGTPITITKHLKAQAWVTSKNASLSASVSMGAVATTRAAYLVPKDIQIWHRPDGDLDGDTVFTLMVGNGPPNDPLSIFVPLSNDQHFEWALEGPWSQTSIQDGSAIWNGPNVAIDWNGLDASYHFTPVLYYNYNYYGCYLQRTMDQLYQESNAPYSGNPTPKELTLKVSDLGDGVTADQKLYLKVHCPIDDWHEDDSVTYRGPEVDVVEIQLDATGKLTSSFDVEGSASRTATADVSTEFPIKTPFVEIPISVKLGYSYSQSKKLHFSAESQLSPPAGAASVLFYWQERIEKKIGRVSSWNRSGLVGYIQQTPCEWFDPNTYRIFIGYHFRMDDGSLID